jgi:hypothetical protein
LEFQISPGFFGDGDGLAIVVDVLLAALKLDHSEAGCEAGAADAKEAKPVAFADGAA